MRAQFDLDLPTHEPIVSRTGRAPGIARRKWSCTRGSSSRWASTIVDSATSSRSRRDLDLTGLASHVVDPAASGPWLTRHASMPIAAATTAASKMRSSESRARPPARPSGACR